MKSFTVGKNKMQSEEQEHELNVIYKELRYFYVGFFCICKAQHLKCFVLTVVNKLKHNMM